MKAAVVKFSTIQKYNRLDAGFYLGQIDGKEQAEKVEKARRNVDLAIIRLQNAIAEATEVSARTQRMIQEGEVIPIES